MAKRFFKRTAKKRSARKSKSFSSKSFRKAVQTVIHKDVETKSAYTFTNAVAFNSGMTVVGDCIQIVPNISRGVDDNERIGQQLRAQKLKIKGFLTASFNYVTASASRIGVRVMIVQPKMYSDLTSILAGSPVWLPTLLKQGGATVAFTGIVNDLQADVNTDAITKYYDKIFYMNAPYVYTSVGVVDTRNTVKFFSKTLNLRNKLMLYDDDINAGLTSTNYNPVMLVGYCHLDGSGPDTVSTQVSMTCDNYLYFEDA